MRGARKVSDVEGKRSAKNFRGKKKNFLHEEVPDASSNEAGENF